MAIYFARALSYPKFGMCCHASTSFCLMVLTSINGNFRILNPIHGGSVPHKALCCGDIPLHRPKKIGLIYGIGTSNLGSWNGNWFNPCSFLELDIPSLCMVYHGKSLKWMMHGGYPPWLWKPPVGIQGIIPQVPHKNLHGCLYTTWGSQTWCERRFIIPSNYS